MRSNYYGDECLINSCIVIFGELLHCYENGDIVIPPMAERIKVDENNGYSAFQECTITSLEIPRSLKEIRKNTFSEQTEPVKINYNGTKNEWEENKEALRRKPQSPERKAPFIRLKGSYPAPSGCQGCFAPMARP